MMIMTTKRAWQLGLEMIGRPPRDDQELHSHLHGDDVFDTRRILSIGGGILRHQAWRNLDFATEHCAINSPHIEWDMKEFRPLPVESGTIDVVYSLHTIEHVQDRHVRHMLAESFRALTPGGIVQLTCPDIALYHRAYLAGDVDFFPHAEVYAGSSIEQRFLLEFATLMSSACRIDVETIKIGDNEIRARLGTDLDTAALDDFCQRIDYDRFYKTFPGAHCNWWTHSKALFFLREAGFSEVAGCGCRHTAPIPRNADVFDRQMPTRSMFVEGIKPLEDFVCPLNISEWPVGDPIPVPPLVLAPRSRLI